MLGSPQTCRQSIGGREFAVRGKGSRTLKTAATRRLAHSIWTLHTTAQLDTLLRALALETDPDKRRLLQAEADRYEQLLASGDSPSPRAEITGSRRHGT